MGSDLDPAPAGGELHGVGEEIGEDLLDFCLILLDRLEARADLEGDVDRLLLGHRPGHVALRRDDRLDIERHWADLRLPGLDLGQVKDVVDHVEEHPPRGADVLHVAALLVVERLDRPEHVREADDAVEWCAQLVAHRRQEVALHPIHLVEVEIGAGELVHLAVEALIDLLELLLSVDEAAEHAIEGDAELLELVGGVNLGPGLDVAAADLVADIAEMLERLDDHVADDEVGGEHGEEHRHDRRR